jgi:hypothetical protein
MQDPFLTEVQAFLRATKWTGAKLLTQAEIDPRQWAFWMKGRPRRRVSEKAVQAVMDDVRAKLCGKGCE